MAFSANLVSVSTVHLLSFSFWSLARDSGSLRIPAFLGAWIRLDLVYTSKTTVLWLDEGRLAQLVPGRKCLDCPRCPPYSLALVVGA